MRVDGRPLAVTMRTPGHDVELAHGFLLTEGVIAGNPMAAVPHPKSAKTLPKALPDNAVARLKFLPIQQVRFNLRIAHRIVRSSAGVRDKSSVPHTIDDSDRLCLIAAQ